MTLGAKIRDILILPVAMLILAGCSSKEFKIEGTLQNTGTQNFRMVYTSNNAITSLWMPLQDGKFEFKGHSSDLTMVEIYSRSMSIIARVPIRNGETVKLNGNLSNPQAITMEGTELSREWSEFINANAKAIKEHNMPEIASAIEKYAKKGGNTGVAALAVAFLYADADNIVEAEKMMDGLNSQELPQIALSRLLQMSDHEIMLSTPTDTIKTIRLYSSRDSFVTLYSDKAKSTILFFRNLDQTKNSAPMQRLIKLSKEYAGDKLQIADITLNNDTLRWKRMARADSVKWVQMWMPCGPANPEIKNLGVPSAPYYIVLGKGGKVEYRGRSIDAAAAAVKSLQ